MSNIKYTPEAEDDLAKIKEYISGHLESPIAAENTVAKITKKIRKLEQFPEMGAPLSSIVNIVTDYRFLVCASYLAFYRIDGNNVYIIRVLYGRRDYITILFGVLPPDEIE
ncbi:MAG: type II toxin-antitoxin system RelE/ParE family toxin [Clostridiales bacterium]|jgi:addiction module RelE/StbE family toxin|nr:type II toxin-antitoxin system RelE/ParE family toxin [Clostridiales bacterium]